MGRAIGAIIGGIVVWMLIATLLNIGLRHGLPGYAQGEPSLSFTLPMKIARLAIAIVSSLVAGATVHRITPSTRAPWIAGGILLAMFLPEHVMIGSRLPIWYHLFFLLTLAPLVKLGAMLTARRSQPR